MLGRTLGSAAWAIALGLAAALPAQAQNLEAGKSPAQIFNGACAVCHKSPRGLVKSVPPPSLPGYLRQHYTTSSDMAGILSGYLLANGAVAVDRRPAADKPSRRGRDTRPAAAPEPAPASGPPSWWPFRSGAQPAQSAGAAPGSEAEPRPGRKAPAKRRAHRKDEDKAKGEAHHTAPAAGESAAPAAKSEAPPAPKAEADHKPAAGAGSSSDGEGASSRRDPVPVVTPAPHAAEPKPAEPAPAAEPKAD